MDYKKLLEYAELFSNASEIPICIFKNYRLNYSFNAGNKLHNYYVKAMEYTRMHGPFVWEDGLLMSYLLETDTCSILFGPVRTSMANKNDYRSFIYHIGMIDERILNELVSNYSTQRIYTMHRFKSAVDSFALAVSDHKADFDIHVPILETLSESFSEAEQPIWGHENEQYVTQLKYIIRHGMVNELDQFIASEAHLPYGYLAKDELRHYKNSMMVHIYIVRTAARDGGLDEDLCLRLAESYAQKCELADSVAELRRISIDLRRDYCKRVQGIKSIRTDDLIVLKTVEYIRTHRFEKIDASIISKKLGLSSSYLCSHFKKNTGIGIIHYIQQEKINTAKYLLVSTDYSLSEIASSLSFSSQAYFQKVFKNLVGNTPQEYRISHNRK